MIFSFFVSVWLPRKEKSLVLVILFLGTNVLYLFDTFLLQHDDSAPEFEESVYVERVEEGLTVHFKCPCGKGYQILLSGRSCYYKLM